ncbi:MAG: hypothetical protein JNK56_10100 [Myxococcales bacterium]|nr:hypothetical protein [Myxococcales bacterium]
MSKPVPLELMYPPEGRLSSVAGRPTVDLRNAVFLDGVDGAVVLPADQQVVKSWISDPITQADLVGGSATQVIDLVAEPTALIPLAVYVVTSVETTSSNGSTTGLAAEVGIAADPDAYMATISVYSTAGRKGGAPGVALQSYRANDPIQLKLTATGGAANIGHISALSIRVVLLYLSPPAGG